MHPGVSLLIRYGTLLVALLILVGMFFKARSDVGFRDTAMAIGGLGWIVLWGVAYLWGLLLASQREEIGLEFRVMLLPLGRHAGISQGIRLILANRDLMLWPSRLFWIGFMLLVFLCSLSLLNVK